MPNESLFDHKANNYAQGRPSYAKAAVQHLLNHLKPQDVVADIGSGTGILSREFVSRGIDTYCVEPNVSMRVKAEEALAIYPCFHSVAASAENTALGDCSVQMITAASAFHWFDSEKFKNECRRILSPGGYVALLINARGYDDFTRRQHTLCEKYGVNFVSLAHGYDKTKHLASSFFYGEYQELRFPHPLTYTNADFLARSLSSSYAPLPDNPSYIPYVEELTQLVNQYSRNNMLFLPSHATILFWGRV